MPDSSDAFVASVTAHAKGVDALNCDSRIGGAFSADTELHWPPLRRTRTGAPESALRCSRKRLSNRPSASAFLSNRGCQKERHGEHD
jgi:hypothetical protein